MVPFCFMEQWLGHFVVTRFSFSFIFLIIERRCHTKSYIEPQTVRLEETEQP